MKNLIITISRQYGSGGRKIGQQLAEELGIPFYDSEIIDLAAKESGLAADFIRGQEQQLTQSLLFSLVTNFTSNAGAFNPNMLSLSDQVYLAQAKAIRALADKGPCVIVGRNADYILKDHPEALHVYVFADIPYRAERIVRRYGESEKSPEQRLNEKDKRRRVNYQHYTGRTWGMSQNYDISLDTGVLGIEQCVDIICKIVENSKK